MDSTEFLELMDSGRTVSAGSEAHRFMHEASQRALRITARINTGYHEPAALRALFSELTGRPVDEGFGLFPPFYTDCGQNIHVGKNVFINMGCKFQDQGGIFLGDGALIGHNVVLATLNHAHAPQDRGSMQPAPIRIGKNVWIGANAVVLPGVTVGDGAIVAAGAVVTRDVPANAIVGGVPARILRYLNEEELQ